jgi:hypothetical protein
VGDGLRDGEGEGDGGRLGDGLGSTVVGASGWWVAFTVVAAACGPCVVNMKTTIAVPAPTATTMAPITATAERKLVSSIQVFSITRIRWPRFTSQHDTGTNRDMRRNGIG